MTEPERIPGTPERLSGPELAAAADPYGWFLPARIARARTTGTEDPLWEAVAPWRAQSSLATETPEAAAFTHFTADDIIERFLGEEDLRIVADEGAPDEEIRTAAELDDEDELVSEELAEIYLAQGLREQAAAIYRKLSLLNPEKSVYFAELLRKTGN